MEKKDNLYNCQDNIIIPYDLEEKIYILNIVGEILGHEKDYDNGKTTDYSRILPELAKVEADNSIKGILVLINTMGGDVESGLAIAEMISSLSKPVVSLVLGGGHSIGVPLAVSGNHSIIAPTATMIVHPIRMNGTVLGVRQNYEYIDKMQDRILEFTTTHSNISKDDLKRIMFNTKELTKDIGTVLVGKEAVDIKLIDETGGINTALKRLYDLIIVRKNSKI